MLTCSKSTARCAPLHGAFLLDLSSAASLHLCWLPPVRSHRLESYATLSYIKKKRTCYTEDQLTERKEGKGTREARLWKENCECYQNTDIRPALDVYLTSELWRRPGRQLGGETEEEGGTDLAPIPTPTPTNSPQRPTRCHTLSSTVRLNQLNQLADCAPSSLADLSSALGAFDLFLPDGELNSSGPEDSSRVGTEEARNGSEEGNEEEGEETGAECQFSGRGP